MPRWRISSSALKTGVLRGESMKVENRKIIRTLTWRNLKAGRMRNLIAIVAIALTATLFTTIFAIGGNVINSMQDATMRQVGTSSHGGLKYLTQEQYDNFAASPLITNISYSIIVGMAENPELLEKQTEIRYAEDDFARWGFSYPAVGDMPRQRMDLACSTITLDALGLPHELGQKVPLTFTVHGQTYHEEFTLCGFWPGDDVMMATQVFLSREYVDSVLTVPQHEVDWSLENDAVIGTISADVWFSSSVDIEGRLEQLVAERGYAPGEINTGINWAYLGGEIDLTTALLVVVLALIVLVSGYLIIYSIFTISVTGDIQFYGLLKTIGTTGKQLRRIVRRQALLLSAVGIPLGLALGFLLGWVLTPYITGITSLRSHVAISVNPLIFVFSALFSLVTVFISCRKPGRVAGRVSPVEAVRYADAAPQGKRKQKKAHRVSPFAMAWANVRRSPKKLVVVVASLSLSLVLMNSVWSIVQGFDMEEYLKNQMRTDFAVADASLYNAMTSYREYEGVDAATLTGIESLAGLEDIGSIYFYEDYSHQLSPKAVQTAREVLAALRPRVERGWATAVNNLDEAGRTGVIPMHIYGLGDLALRMATEDSPDTAEKLASGNYAFISHVDVDYDDEYAPLYEVGDLIPLVNAEGETQEFEVIGILDIPFVFYAQHGHIIESDIILAENIYLDFYGDRQPMMTVFNVDDEHLSAAEEWMAAWSESGSPGLDYRSRQYYIGEFEQMQTTYLVCGGALAAILMLIGILNFVNTSFTSIFSRKRELAMLQSVGMTGRQLRAMLFGEGALYAALTLLFAATAGSLLSWGIIRTMAGELWFFQWHFTLMPLLAAAAPLAVVCMIVPLVCYHFMQKESVVDRLRQE